MTDPVRAGMPARRTRRQLLAGGTGALAAVLTAEALARPAPAHAANGDPVILAGDNTATAVTNITNTAAGVDALDCFAAGDGSGVEGASATGRGVSGFSGTSYGVVGSTNGAMAAGVFGENNVGGNGVNGLSGGTASAFTAGIGVSGITDNASGYGVLGENAAVGGTGVAGTAVGDGAGVSGAASDSNGVGVAGTGGFAGVQGIGDSFGMLGIASKASGVGVNGRALSATAVGVLAENTAGGTALVVSGKAAFTNCGLLTVATGKSSATQKGVPLAKFSLVLATLQQDRPGVWIRSAVPNLAGQSFTVHLSKAVTAATEVAWFIVEEFIM
jgi:hypothetical protein